MKGSARCVYFHHSQYVPKQPLAERHQNAPSPVVEKLTRVVRPDMHHVLHQIPTHKVRDYLPASEQDRAACHLHFAIGANEVPSTCPKHVRVGIGRGLGGDSRRRPPRAIEFNKDMSGRGRGQGRPGGRGGCIVKASQDCGADTGRHPRAGWWVVGGRWAGAGGRLWALAGVPDAGQSKKGQACNGAKQ